MGIRKSLLLLTAVGALSLGASACGPAEYGVAGIDVGFGPPALQAEVSVESPGPGYYWVPGYYDWDGGNYTWVAGSWVRPPHEGAVWVAPRYEERGSHHVYHRGQWQDRNGRGDDRHDRDHRDGDHRDGDHGDHGDHG
jgi:hypothetical protein